MTDLVIRDVPDEVVAAIDAAAERLDITRNQFLHRAIRNAARTSGHREVTMEDLQRFAERHADLADQEVMGRAWQ